MTSNVTTITLTDSSTQSVKTYTSSFPDSDIDSSSDYAILIVESPKLTTSNFTFTKDWIEGSIVINVFATKSEAADKFMDDILDSIETNKDNLRALGLMMIELEETDKDPFFRGDLKIHSEWARFRFKYTYTHTQVY